MGIGAQEAEKASLHPLDQRPLGPLWVFGSGYAFISDLLRLGVKKPLEAEDVPPLPSALCAAAAFGRLERCQETPGCSLRDALWLLLRGNIGLVVAHCSVFLVFKLSTVFIFWWLLEALGADGALPPWHAWASAVLLGLTCYFIAVFMGSGQCKSVLVAVAARQAVSVAVFQAVLRLPASGVELGSVSSALSQDVERIYLSCLELNFLVCAVGMLVGGSVVLASQVHVGALVALVFLVLVQLAQKHLQAKIGRARRSTSAWTDRRVALSSQLLQGIRPIRMNGWDPSLRGQIESLRCRELAALRRVQLWKALNFTISSLVPTLCTVLVLLTAALIEGPEKITPTRFFVVISIVNPCIRSGMDMLPRSANLLSEALVALERIEALLKRSHAQPRGGLDTARQRPASPRPSQEGKIVSLWDATFAWPGAEAEAFRLRNVSLDVTTGSLVCVLGEVGSGKSALLSALLGELALISGTGLASNRPACRGQGPFLAAYCGQQPWVRTLTVRENILLAVPDRPADEACYRRAVKAAQLTTDIEAWAGGDLCEVGERGLTLSGGQKARLALARAAYAALTGAVDAVLLDDVLAALDGQVAQRVVEECLLGAMSGMTRVVVLSSPHALLRHADAVLVLERGHLRRALAGEVPVPSPVANASAPGTATDDEVDATDIEVEVRRRSLESQVVKLLSAEEREKGTLKVSAVAKYFGWSSGLREANPFRLLGVLSLFALCELLRIGFDAWLAYWAQCVSGPEEAPGLLGEVASGLRGLGASAVVCVLVFASAALRSVSFMGWAHKCSRHLYNGALSSVAGASITAFFDVTPTGRLVNTFSRDCDVLDSVLPDTLHMNLTVGTDLLLGLAVCALTAPPYLILIPPLLLYTWRTRVLFGASARELKRLDAVSRSPVLTLVIETLQGLTPMRALGLENSMQARFLELMDENGRHFFHLGMLSPWMILRLNGVAAAFVLGVSVSAAALRSTLPATVLGLGIAYALNLMGKLQTLSRYSVELEQMLTSAERLDSLRDAPAEPGPAARAASREVPVGWPFAGHLEVSGLSVRYREGTPLVLRDISFVVPAGCKLGVVGRSGCGKSTLMQALLRLVEPSSGSIRIDGVDIQSLTGSALRQRIAVIPQDPYLWSGTLRVNLDPTRLHSDAEILAALETCRMRGRFEALVKEAKKPLLEAEVKDAGSNLSVGERQLLCLCRALLRRSRLNLLDEATANIDQASEARLQAVLSSEFASATLVVVAHRLATVRESDLVLRLDAGAVAALGPPEAVLGGEALLAAGSGGPPAAVLEGPPGGCAPGPSSVLGTCHAFFRTSRRSE